VVELGVTLERLADRGEVSTDEMESLVGDLRSLNNPNPNGDAVVRAAVETDGLDVRLALRYADGDLDKSHLRRADDLLGSGEMDRVDFERMLGMLETKETSPFVGTDTRPTISPTR